MEIKEHVVGQILFPSTETKDMLVNQWYISLQYRVFIKLLCSRRLGTSSILPGVSYGSFHPDGSTMIDN